MASEQPGGALRALAAEAWAFRWREEREAELRFAKLADALVAAGAREAVVELARRAAGDEHRHIALCAELLGLLGAPVNAREPATLAEIVPAALGPREALAYEVVAACCIAETESNGTLLTLLSSRPGPLPRFKEVLRTIAEDEVQHSRLGWAYLADSAASGAALGFLGSLIPSMLGEAESLYRPPARPELESEGLLAFGVLPFSQKREVFGRMLREVILPGLSRFGIDRGPALGWLLEREGQTSTASGSTSGPQSQRP